MGMGGGMGNNAQPNSNEGDRVLATLEVTGSDVPTLPAVAAQPEPRDSAAPPSPAAVNSPSP